MEKLIMGTYTGPAPDHSQGTYMVGFNGAFIDKKLLAENPNPSWLSYSGETNILYAVEEVQQGKLHVYRVDDAGSAERLQTVASRGASPCHLALSPDGRFLAVANYMGGNIALYALDKQGLTLGEAQVIQHQGSGPNKDRQEAAHAHWVGWSKRMDYLYVVDLGIDKIMAYPFDSSSGELAAGFVAFQAEPGSGPRHMLFHPEKNAAYIVNELNNTLVYATINERGMLSAVSTLSLLPEDFSGHSQAAHIAIHNNVIYVSNRGHDSIAVFSLDEQGIPALRQWQSTLGHWPRHFSISGDGKTLWLANEQQDQVRAFSVAGDGRLSPLDAVLTVSKPTFISHF